MLVLYLFVVGAGCMGWYTSGSIPCFVIAMISAGVLIALAADRGRYHSRKYNIRVGMATIAITLYALAGMIAGVIRHM